MLEKEPQIWGNFLHITEYIFVYALELRGIHTDTSNVSTERLTRYHFRSDSRCLCIQVQV